MRRKVAGAISALFERQRRRRRRLVRSQSSIYLGDYTALARLQAGPKIFVDTRDLGIAAHLMLDGYWEPWVERVLMKALKPGMTFCDVGANFGYYTLLGAATVGQRGKVFSFECNPRLSQLLRKSVLVNGMQDVVTLSSMAVSNVQGHATLTFDDEFSGGGTIVEVGPDYPWSEHKVTVACAPLDSLLDGQQVPNVLKIDVEGSEAKVLLGAERILSDRGLQTIVFEYYAPSIIHTMAPISLLQKLSSVGFQLQILTESGPASPQSPEALAATIGDTMAYLAATRR